VSDFKGRISRLWSGWRLFIYWHSQEGDASCVRRDIKEILKTGTPLFPVKPALFYKMPVLRRPDVIGTGFLPRNNLGLARGTIKLRGISPFIYAAALILSLLPSAVSLNIHQAHGCIFYFTKLDILGTPFCLPPSPCSARVCCCTSHKLWALLQPQRGVLRFRSQLQCMWR
jgi:hypothetical protein